MNFSIARCLFSIGGCTTILGNISADTAVSSAGAIGGLGVLTIAVNYTLNLLKKKDEQLMAKDARIASWRKQPTSPCWMMNDGRRGGLSPVSVRHAGVNLPGSFRVQNQRVSAETVNG